MENVVDLWDFFRSERCGLGLDNKAVNVTLQLSRVSTGADSSSFHHSLQPSTYRPSLF